MKNDEKLVKELKTFDYKHWTTTMWLVKRHMIEKTASYKILRVDTDKKLQSRLKKIITQRVQSNDYRLEPYSYSTSDQDNATYTLDTAETDFKEIKKELENGLSNEKVESYEDLLNSWAYVIEIKAKGQVIYGLRKINTLTQAKKVNSLSSLIFKDQVLVDLTDERIFTIDPHIDLYEYSGTVFITNKKEFESVLNFRKGMEDNRDLVLEEFNQLGLFQDVQPIRQVIGNNIHWLRKISTVKKNGYYKDKKYIENLKTICENEKWDVKFIDDKIIVTQENVDLILTLLNNSRLKSPINQEVFDAIVKNKVA